MAMAEKFDSLEEHLEKFVENIRQLGIIVSDFQPSSQAGLNQKLNFMVTGLQDIDKCRQQLHDISVPLEVFEYIDQGRNPQLYTKECLERALAKNEQVKGKIDTMKGTISVLQLWTCGWRRNCRPCARSHVSLQVPGLLGHTKFMGHSESNASYLFP
ncbi:mediator of RNA polymerase II transcription subunit 10 isoform X2 [Tympanuchus pallidicinctus]|uniref:mediator of RNA polymerase II transcription subunit 10 isoform X2 n=1 Tax=Tympanuchus pallidicinctus TaxID=109042 RepID=UPI0022873E9F|nr:mediator of RNA polymerase II transcription subunit 10 isoform X2 [Tympanuchus pallidicinctus]